MRRDGTRGTLREGTHIGTLDVGRARVVGDGIRGAGSEHGWGERRRTGLHEHARITTVPTMTRWSPGYYATAAERKRHRPQTFVAQLPRLPQ